MSNIHIISHTHWDREWYLPFQQFRLRLIHLVDNLLVILAKDPTYQHFMLDGQTIVLEDYLQMRMNRMAELADHIRSNRVLIGPWYILPDEFLVSPEATIRNLLIGKKLCEMFGQRMMVGYIPDPFGHISQLPQILQGFHIDTACLWRGVPVGSPTLLWWQSPDGSRVLLAHLYTSYGNGAHLPAEDTEETAEQLQEAVDALAPFNPVSHYLIMRGSDHMEPRPTLPEQIREINQMWAGEAEILHSTLPAYLAAASNEIRQRALTLQSLQGELRDPHKAHMLPGVLSARMWIKQRNHAAETALERWVEPFSTWAELALRGDHAFLNPDEVAETPRIVDPAALIHQAWKLLITNHPHDSICGCSVDQTHTEMRPRFDQVDQISEELTLQSLQALAGAVNTSTPEGCEDAFAAVTVFNAAPFAQGGNVEVAVDLPDLKQPFKLVDESGAELTFSMRDHDQPLIRKKNYPISELPGLISTISQFGHTSGQLVNAILSEENGMPLVEAEFSNVNPVNTQNLGRVYDQLMQLVETSAPGAQIMVDMKNAWTARISLSVPSVPALGMRTFWAVPAKQADEQTEPSYSGSSVIENEYFRVTLTKAHTLDVLDKRSGHTYEGLNAFKDVADAGDEYNFCPHTCETPLQPLPIAHQVRLSKTKSEMLLTFGYDLPAELEPERFSRSKKHVMCQLTSTVTLSKGVPRIDFHTEFDNLAKDHRLSVHFPTGLQVDRARFDGHFDVVERSLNLPKTDETWMEQPRPEVPQRAFCDVTSKGRGLMLANRGLPEVAVLKKEDGTAEIGLTLLRCVGWLSRDDMWVRKGHAGPGYPTPDAQELAHYSFDYALIPHDSDWLKASQQAYAFQTPLRALVTDVHEGSLPVLGQVVSCDRPEFLITAVKAAENERVWIVRGVNLADATIEVTLKPFRPFPAASLVYLDESFKAPLAPAEDGSVSFLVGKKEIATVRFGLKAEPIA